MITAWRICRRQHVTTAFDGEGARRYPGRWNHRGVPLVYCATTLSLATLEVLVHTDPDDIPSDLVAIRVRVPTSDVTKLDPARLPADWRAFPGPTELRDLGSAWAPSVESVALRVPSAVIPSEDNLLLNPAHPRFSKVRTSEPEPFAFDPRLFTASRR